MISNGCLWGKSNNKPLTANASVVTLRLGDVRNVGVAKSFAQLAFDKNTSPILGIELNDGAPMAVSTMPGFMRLV